MNNNYNLDFNPSGENVNGSSEPYSKDQHLSLSQLRDHLNKETIGHQQHVIDMHILRCSRCRSIWDGLVHFSTRKKRKNILKVWETRLLRLIATQDLQSLSLKGMLVLIGLAIGLGIITYEFGENKMPAFVNIPVTHVAEVTAEPVVESAIPVIDLVKQGPIYPSNTFKTASFEAQQLDSKRDTKVIAMEPEINNASSANHKGENQTPTTKPVQIPTTKPAKEKPMVTPSKTYPDRKKEPNPMPRKPTLKTIKGIVVSEEGGIPLPGVKVTIPGLSVTVLTDQEGAYRIGVPIENTELVFDYGNAQVHQPLDSTNQLVNVVMPNLKAEKEKILNISPYPITSVAYYKTYLKHNLKYPPRALRHDISGTVIVAFTVEVDGRLTNLRVSQSLGYGCDKEAIRLIREGPDWHPALVNGAPVAKESIILVNFQR